MAWRIVCCMVLASILSGGCQSERTPADTVQLQTAQLPIKGGYNSVDTAVVGLGMASQGGFGTCSGTIISANVIMTAQHCISDMSTQSYVDCSESTFGPSQDPFYVFVTNQSPMPWNPDAYIRCREVLVPEASNWACGYDIALLILEDPIPWNVEPMVPRVDTAPVLNDTYSAIGYGATNGEGGGSGTRRRRDDLVVTCGPGECPTWYPMEPSEWIGDEGVCQGDSGGPAVDAFGRVIGVASRGGGECSSPVYSGVSPWGEWIKDTVVYAAGLAGLDVPAWAMGWPTHPDYGYAIGGWCGVAADCDSGLCAGGICTRKCGDVAPCPTGFYCSDVEVCELVPVGGRCAEATECLGGWCLDGTCSRTCSEEMPCPDGFECDPVSVGCRPEIGAYCIDSAACISEICLGELCTRECDADLDCPDGWNCTNGACLLDKVGMGCKDDLACPGGYCVDGICSRTCADNAPCPAGYRCDTAEGVCQLVPAGSACVSNVDCNFSVCIDGTCTRSCSNEAPCPAGMHCDADSGHCAETPVGDACGEDSACLSGLCVDGACTRSCDTEHPCLAGFGCDSGICVLTPIGSQCTTAADCPGGLCSDGACSQPCSDTSPCQSGYVCDANAGSCQAEAGCSATQSGHIPSGWLLLLGLLFVGWRRRVIPSQR